MASLTQKQFEGLINRAYERLPKWVKDKVKNVAILTAPVADEDTMLAMDLKTEMDLLGLYQGLPLTARDHGVGVEFPDTITLYKFPIEDEAARSGKSVADVIFETLWHEIAHHFGLDEEAVEKREKEEFGI